MLTNVSEVYDIWPEYWGFGVENGVYGPQIITCDVPKEYANQPPRGVSLQLATASSEEDQCKGLDKSPSNVMRVMHNQRDSNYWTPSIGICVQAMRFSTYDISVRLVEWLEMVKLMGADQVYFYVFGAADNVVKVMNHYKGFVDWRHLTLPGTQPNIEPMYNYYASKKGGKFWPQELLELNDCLYRNLYRHDYVVIMDIDEMIVPQQDDNWHQLLKRLVVSLVWIPVGKIRY